jgi:FtsP/CotA-like multicopper oxidase with cupredoxin domain
MPGFGPPNSYNTPNAAGAVGGNPDVAPYLQDGTQPPLPEEAGWKDVFKMFPGQVTRVVVRFTPQANAAGSTVAGTNYFPFDPTTGPGYVVHCHILDHEDNEMMRPYIPRK